MTAKKHGKLTGLMMDGLRVNLRRLILEIAVLSVGYVA
jgi:hypothetical protein